jgi:glyoxylase-like metal-dependent hydrolase (beta-lactamase superfamily II)
LANEFVGPERRIFIREADRKYLESYLRGETSAAMRDRLISEGFPQDLLKRIDATNPGRVNTLEYMTPRFYGLADGELIKVGEYTLQTIPAPGHTPGNSMFLMEAQRIMFTGDHVLFDITPNITAWAGVEDALGDYLDSLRRTQDYPVELALPGHREPGRYLERIRQLLEHHKRRLAQCIAIVTEMPGLTAYGIASRMTWKIRADSWETFPPVQKRYAVGECLSHLDHLRKRKLITREMCRTPHGMFESETAPAPKGDADDACRGAGLYRYFADSGMGTVNSIRLKPGNS